jgi:hypothetical protein
MGCVVRNGSFHRLAFAGAFGFLVSASAHAELSYGLETGIGYSDNIRRVEGAGVTDEKIGIFGVDLTWNETTRRLDGDAVVDLSYNEYLDDTYDSEVVGTADGSLTLGIVPERFTWVFDESFGQAQTDPFAPATPDTSENINYFSTGPNVILRFGAAAGMRLFGRYSITSYEESPLDSDRTLGGAALFREISASSTLSLNGVAEQIDVEQAGADYDRDSAFFSYELDGGRTDLTTQLGYTWLKPETGEDNDGLLASIMLTRVLSASSTLYMEVGTQFTDAAEALRGALDGAVGGVDIAATSDPFENRTAELRWSFARNRTTFGLGASWNEDRYEHTTDLDRTRYSYEATFSRRLGRQLDFELSAVYDDENFDNTAVHSKELRFMSVLSWQVGRNLGLALTFERNDRSTSNGLGEYVENRGYLLLTYGRGNDAAVQPMP